MPRWLSTAMVVLASVLAFFALMAIWVDRQALNTDNWAQSSSELLESSAIRNAVATYLVDEAYVAYDVPGELEAALPPRAKPLAGPAASGLRDLAVRGVDRLLQRPRVQALWETANRRAHTRLMQILDDGSGPVSTAGGVVTLDLQMLVQQAAGGIGVGERLAGRIPEGTGQIVIARSNQLATAQDVARALQVLPIVLLVVTLALFAGAIAGARGRRRETLRAAGIGFVAAGIAALLARGIGGDEITNALATTAAAQPVAEDVWEIATTQLTIAAQATIGYGVAIVAAAWLAGPTTAAVATRRAAAPYLRDPRYAFGAVAALLLLLIVWDPTPATHNPLALLLFAALLAGGMEVLRRQTAREHPAAAPELGAHLRQAWTRARTGVSERAARPQPPAAVEEDRFATIERLARLRDTGALTDAEFAAEKRRLLGGPPA